MTANGDILVHIETRNGAIQPVSLELLTAARELAGALGKKVEALVAAAAPQQVAGQLGAADRVLTVSHPALERYTPEAYGAVLAETVRQRDPAVVLLGYSSVGLDLAPNLAVRTGRPLVSYCVKLAIAGDAIEADSMVYGGKLRATTKVTLPAIFTVTPGSYAEAQTGTSPTEIVDLVPPEAIAALRTVFVSETKPPPDAIDLAQAERILCVGRGISDKDSIAIAEEVASALGAEIAGSRPVIDAGWLPKERQVGKSGTKVKPKLYIAAGVSGAPEHLEGMSTAELIVAINSDAKAPIFGIAHYGTTCDLFDLLPALGERLKSTQSG
jgi:electron transfer flavoprotein alpha subunit